jgi:uncharacterized damage-inducible protein DinB
MMAGCPEDAVGYSPGRSEGSVMKNLQPEQGMLLLQIWLPGLKNEHRTTRSVIEAIPMNAPDYRPDAKAKSALELAWHIASAQNFFLSAIADGAFNMTSSPRPESVRTSADIAGWFGESFANNYERLAGMSGEALVKIVDFRGLFQFPAVMFLQFEMNHEIHHRGQLSTYLRPMGAKVPAIYGESYDSAEAKKVAGKA